MDHRWTLAGSAMLLLALAAPNGGVQAAGAYTIEDLGPAALQTVATAVNADGIVAGYGVNASFQRQGFGHDTAPFLVPGLGGPSTEMTGINVDGVMSGFSDVALNMPHAITYDSASGTLVNLDPAGQGSYAYGLNDTGAVVGAVVVGFGRQAVRWSAGVRTDLGSIGGSFSQAWAINNAGVIVGEAADASNVFRAFRYTDADGMVAMETLGGFADAARAVNASGVAAGYASANGTSLFHAARWSASGAITDLGTLGGMLSAAYGINSTGDIVGWSLDSANQNRAFLYSNGAMVDLNTLLPAGSGWTLTHAYAINDAGVIVGAGILDGRMRAFRLTPAEAGDDTAPVIDSVQATPNRLWPPRHQMVDVSVSVEASDDSGETPACSLISVTSNQPDDSGGDGDTANDIEITGPLSVRLRAERAGSQVRVYTLTVECRDAAGNSSTGVAKVKVKN